MAIVKEVSRFSYCLGRQIRALAGFSGERACDRRLKKLIDAGYLERKHVLYGLPRFYFLGKKAKILTPIKYYSPRIKLGEVYHDLAVVDTVIFFTQELKIPLDDIRSERELHSMDGFGVRKHCPDFIFFKNDKKYCVEVELSLKSKGRLLENIKENFTNYDGQFYIVPKGEHKIRKIIEESSITKIKIIDLENTEKMVKARPHDSEQENI